MILNHDIILSYLTPHSSPYSTYIINQNTYEIGNLKIMCDLDNYSARLFLNLINRDTIFVKYKFWEREMISRYLMQIDFSFYLWWAFFFSAEGFFNKCNFELEFFLNLS